MADVNVVIDQAGPLPIKAMADIETDGPAVVTMAGSVWSTTANQMLGFGLLIDGEKAPTTATIFSNGPSEHRAVVPVTFTYTFTIGSHTFELEPTTFATTSDGNDRFVVTVQY